MNQNVTYSPAYTLVPTHECFNRCTYCNFRQDPGESPWMTFEEAKSLLEAQQRLGVVEVLILSGEVHPQSPRREAWFRHIYGLCELALSLGLLPHTNVGPLKFEEMRHLGQVNVSMGLMLEQVTPELQDTVHRYAPSKGPAVRLQQLEWAGHLKIPFTTGLLLGIGETVQDWWESLEAIALLHSRYHHIQEVILQPYSPGTQQAGDAPGFPLAQLPEVVAFARRWLPLDITLQIPPNLVTQPSLLLACLDAGARDLGGIGCKDEVNPDYPHPHPQALLEILEPAGWKLQKRLPVYPQYYHWLADKMQVAVQNWQSVTLYPLNEEMIKNHREE